MSLLARLDAIQTDDDRCIIWPQAPDGSGYAQGWLEGRRVRLHVVICTRTHGARPPGKQAAHDCGVRRCVNRRHISWKSPGENAADRTRHGTENQGSRHGAAKLTESAVMQIRKARADGQRPTDLALQFGVSVPTVSNILARRTWRHV